jgi:hypothetical protein
MLFSRLTGDDVAEGTRSTGGRPRSDSQVTQRAIAAGMPAPWARQVRSVQRRSHDPTLGASQVLLLVYTLGVISADRERARFEDHARGAVSSLASELWSA